jgi:DKNYY family
MKLQYACFWGLLLGSCAPHNSAKPVPTVETNRLDTTLPCFQWRCESLDSANYTHLKASFYKGNDGEVYEKRYFITPWDSCCYYRAFYDNKLGHSLDTPRPSFKKVLDLSTYVELEPSVYAKDRSHVYGEASNSDGGFRYWIEEADAKTFHCLDSTRWWGVDKEHVFYRGDLIKGLSAHHLKTLKVVLSNPQSGSEVQIVRSKPSYVKNDHQVFFEKEPVLKADAASFKVVDSSRFDAIDKYRKYSQGHPVD